MPCKLIDGVEVVSVVGRQLAPTEEVARKYGVPHATTDLAEALARPGRRGRILCTPTQMHAAQALQCLNAGKHVQVEIPLADSLADAQAVAELAQRTGLVCMVGHTRRFNPSHQWIHRRIARRRDRHPADGRADVFLPPHQHECAGPAAFVDRSPAVAPRRAHRGPVSLPGAVGNRARQRRAGAYPPARSASRWTCPSSCRPPAAPSARCRCRSTTTGRWARSSATSATTAPTSRVTTSSSTARTTPSTCRRWTSRSTASNCRTASSSPRSATAASRIRAWRRCCRVTARCTSSKQQHREMRCR